MGWYRIYSTKDNWISNKLNDYLDSSTYRITGSNFGRSPTVRVFKLSGTYPNSTVELGRGLFQFDITELSGKIFNDKTIPSSSVTYKLKLFDYKHGGEVPSSYDVNVFPVTRSWDEGNGIDDDSYKDWGWSNWLSSSSTQTWTSPGSDFLTAGFGSGSMHFDCGDEDFEADITILVGNWLTSSVGETTGLNNNGIVVTLSKSQEDNNTEYKTKIFHGRETKYVEKVPYIEANWDSDVIKDHRNNFAYYEDSNLFFYNVIRGELTDVTQPVKVRLQDNLIQDSCSYNASFTASRYDTGIFSMSFNIENTCSFSSSWYDIWFSDDRTFFTGTFTPLVLTGSEVDEYDDYIASIINFRKTYRQSEEVRMKVKFAKRNYTNHVLHTSSLDFGTKYIDKAYYRIYNNENNELFVPFSTGSIKYTKMSYNKDGNYFTLFMENFVPGFQYRIEFLLDVNDNEIIIDDDFLFRVI